MQHVMHRRITGASAAALLALTAAAPAATQTFTPPAGCTGYLTVQSRGCRVSNHYTCEQDAPGDKWRADFDAEGLFFASRIDDETQWVESYEMFPTVKQTLDASPADPASFTELLGGADAFDFSLTKDTGERSLVTGFDQLTGTSVVIDGIPLLQTAYEFTETSIGGTVLRKASGNEYIHPEWRLFFAGKGEADDGAGGTLPFDGSPVEFVFPGEEDFFTTQPIFDCDAILSSAPGQGVIHVRQ